VTACRMELCPNWPGEGCMKGVLDCEDEVMGERPTSDLTGPWHNNFDGSDPVPAEWPAVIFREWSCSEPVFNQLNIEHVILAEPPESPGAAEH
jgi:hypothetical protein